MSETYTEDEVRSIVRQSQSSAENLHSFITNVVKTPNTIKTGNLNETELGLPKLPVRTYKELELFCDDVYDDEGWKDFFGQMAEIQTSTSLSKDAILIKLAVTTKKELADITPKPKAENKGWFKGKNRNQSE